MSAASLATFLHASSSSSLIDILEEEEENAQRAWDECRQQKPPGLWDAGLEPSPAALLAHVKGVHDYCTAALGRFAHLQELHRKHQACQQMLATISAVQEGQRLRGQLQSWKANPVPAGVDAAIDCVQSWRQLLSEHPELLSTLAALRHEEDERVDWSQLAVEMSEAIVACIDRQVDVILQGWSDENADAESSSIIKSSSAEPLELLFTSFPLSKLRPYLQRYARLGHRPAHRLYGQKLLNHFYRITSDPSQGQEKFAVGPLEAIAPDHLRMAVRTGAIVDAARYLALLHADQPVVCDVLHEKASLIVRLIRKDTERLRDYSSVSSRTSPKAIDNLISEVVLIGQKVRTGPFAAELEPWAAIYEALEQIYLQSAISTAVGMDQVSRSSTLDVPVSSCVDDVFFVLEASQARARVMGLDALHVIRAVFEASFLRIVEERIEALVLGASRSAQKELTALVILINNVSLALGHWKTLLGQLGPAADVGADGTVRLLEGLQARAVDGGLWLKCVKAGAVEGGLGSFAQLRQKMEELVLAPFGANLCRPALSRLALRLFNDACGQFLRQLLEQGRAVDALRLDTELHEFEHWLGAHVDREGVAGAVPDGTRLRQALGILMCESRQEAAGMVDEWGEESRLRAGEVLLLLRKL